MGARMIVSNLHGDKDTPPDVPAFRTNTKSHKKILLLKPLLMLQLLLRKLSPQRILLLLLNPTRMLQLPYLPQKQ